MEGMLCLFFEYAFGILQMVTAWQQTCGCCACMVGLH